MSHLNCTSASPLKTEMRLCGLISLFAFLESIVYGFSFPYFSIHLEKNGADAFIIGMNASTGLLAVLLFAPIYPRFMVRYGYKKFSLHAFIFAATSSLALLLSENIYWWCICRFIIGAALAALWVSTESWLNHVVSDKYRGRANAVFQALYSFGFFIGPSLTYFTGFTGATPILALGGLAIFAATLIVLFAPSQYDYIGMENQGRVTLELLSNAKAILIIAAITGLCETAIYSLLPIYGLQHGLSTDVAVAILVAYTLGEVFVALPIGWITDRVEHHSLLFICTILASIFIFLLGKADTSPLMMGGISFFAGGFIVSLYNIALVQLGESYRGTILPIIGTAFSVAYSIGSAAGSSIGGSIMNIVGSSGLPYGIAAILGFAAAVQAFLLVKNRTREVLNRNPSQIP